MTDFYEIVFVLEGGESARKFGNILKLSYIVKVAALIILVLAVFKSDWLYAAAAITYVMGIILRQSTLEMTASYSYAYSKGEIIISKTSNLGAKKTLARIEEDSIIGFDPTGKNIIPYDYELTATDKKECAALFFTENQKVTALFFSPDDYFSALIGKDFTLDREIAEERATNNFERGEEETK